MTKINISPAWKDVKPQGFYVYLHRRASDGTVFYVGKGTLKRAWRTGSSNYRSKHWINCAKKNGVIVDIIVDNLNEEDAFNKEREVITLLNYADFDLVNYCGGGVGPIGMTVSKETREKISLAFNFPVWNDDGECFRNSSVAARAMRERGYPKAASSGIYAAVKGLKSKTAYGYAWSNKTIPPKPKAVGYCASNIESRIPVQCVENGMVFQSLSEAARWVRETTGRLATITGISNCMNGKYRKSYGFTWRKIDE